MSIERFRLRSPGVNDLLTTPEFKADFERRGEAIRQACLSESTWGGYFTATTVTGDRVTTRVWSISSNLPEQHNRHQRLIRNLDAGS